MGFSKVLSRCLLAAILLFAGSASAQFAGQLFGVNPFTNDNTAPPGSFGLFYLDSNTGAITGGRVITVPGRTITGAQALARDPTSGRVYAVVKATAVVGRLLITVNLGTGVGVEIGNLGDSFSSLAFRPDGQLFGVTGDGAAVPSTMYLINKATAAIVLAQTLGAGSDGEVITFHPGDNSFYHWSGGGTVFFERILAVAPFTVTPINNQAASEVFGAIWDPARNLFLVHDIDSVMSFWTTTGVISNAQPATIEDVRGLVLLVGSTAVPTLSEWSLMLLIALILCAAFVTMRRRRGSP